MNSADHVKAMKSSVRLNNPQNLSRSRPSSLLYHHTQDTGNQSGQDCSAGSVHWSKADSHLYCHSPAKRVHFHSRSSERHSQKQHLEYSHNQRPRLLDNDYDVGGASSPILAVYLKNLVHTAALQNQFVDVFLNSCQTRVLQFLTTLESNMHKQYLSVLPSPNFHINQ